jgi:hypothetical protein
MANEKTNLPDKVIPNGNLTMWHIEVMRDALQGSFRINDVAGIFMFTKDQRLRVLNDLLQSLYTKPVILSALKETL